MHCKTDISYIEYSQKFNFARFANRIISIYISYLEFRTVHMEIN